jgi:hypothetical protein
MSLRPRFSVQAKGLLSDAKERTHGLRRGLFLRQFKSDFALFLLAPIYTTSTSLLLMLESDFKIVFLRGQMSY